MKILILLLLASTAYGKFKYYIALLLIKILFFFVSKACSNPKISDVKTFSTQDTKINTETAYVVEFRAQCAGNAKVSSNSK